MLIRNPFQCEVGTVEEAIQEQFLELDDDSSAMDEYSAVELERFWLSVSILYP